MFSREGRFAGLDLEGEYSGVPLHSHAYIDLTLYSQSELNYLIDFFADIRPPP